MKILFTCAFIEILASYDNANYASYLLNFFPARYKACSGMWKFSQLSRKIFKVNVKVVYVRERVFSHFGSLFRKSRCLPAQIMILSVLTSASVMRKIKT